MKLLELLENRVQSLISEMSTLRTENKQLRENLALFQDIMQEKQQLSQELQTQQCANTQTVEHIEKLIKLIQDVLPE